jgi:high affinity Mn2+ porin
MAHPSVRSDLIPEIELPVRNCPDHHRPPAAPRALRLERARLRARLRTWLRIWFRIWFRICLISLTACVVQAGYANAQDAAAPAAAMQAAPATAAVTVGNVEPEAWNAHGQFTFVDQFHPSFRSPYQGANSLTPARNGEETTDLTLFAGVRLWRGGAFYVNPEVDQGFGLSDTLGMAGFPSGEAYKVGKWTPYLRLQRAFLRQRFDLAGESQAISSGPNELGGMLTANNVTVTFGKFSVVDVFDTNSYAHDPRADFLNWSIIDAAAFDYAADAWGYTVGGAVEWTQSWWTLRGGFFDLSNVPNSATLEPGFKEFALIGEFEGRYEWQGHPGKVKLLGFLNHGRMGSYNAAISLGQATGATPDTTLVRQQASRPGVALNLEQELGPALGVFARASFNDGSKEAYEFTDVNRSLALGAVLKGIAWSRPADLWGVAAVRNGISAVARAYFAAGGLGILVGDGQLPHAGGEQIFETFYALRVAEPVTISADYQYVTNPAYNRDRGPVSIFALRLHADF